MDTTASILAGTFGLQGGGKKGKKRVRAAGEEKRSEVDYDDRWGCHGCLAVLLPRQTDRGVKKGGK